MKNPLNRTRSKALEAARAYRNGGEDTQTDPQGSYTGAPTIDEAPVQDADDL